MSTKDHVLRFLEEKKWQAVSGSEIAEALSLSRASVWKAVHALQEEGYPISAASKRGYSLAQNSDILSSASILPYLHSGCTLNKLHVYKELGSTNTTAKAMANDQAPHGTVVIAEHQTAGKGRLGRSFYSPGAQGVYLSVVLRLNESTDVSMLVTSAAAVAVCRAIRAVSGIEAQIKWVNDVYIDGKKVCGILTEASMNFENGQLDYRVLGIGINVTECDFPPELRDVATSLSHHCTSSVDRSRLIGALLNELEAVISTLPSREFLAEYRKRSFLLGERINVITAKETLPGTAVSINDSGHLLVRMDTGDIVGLEANNYWTNHTVRENLTPALSAEEAQRFVSGRLTVEGSRLCVIPVDDGMNTGVTEKLCWEFSGTWSSSRYLVYIDAQTGAEEQVLKVVTGNDGTLTM